MFELGAQLLQNEVGIKIGGHHFCSPGFPFFNPNWLLLFLVSSFFFMCVFILFTILYPMAAVDPHTAVTLIVWEFDTFADSSLTLR